MAHLSFAATSFPHAIQSLFDRIISLDWYDGITSGLVQRLSNPASFRFDLLAWGPFQERRIFVFSVVSADVFQATVRLLSRFGDPVWPRWHAPWPRDMEGAKRLDEQIENLLSNFETPQFVFETDSMFETVFGAREILNDSLKLIPEHFHDLPHLDNYAYWHQYLGLPA